MMAFANIGLTPDRGVSYLLPRVVGLRRALDFTLNRRALTADEALGWSLVNAIADDQAEAAVHVARKISDGPAVALGQARRLLRAAHDVNRDEHAVDEGRTISWALMQEESRSLMEGLSSL